MRFQPLHQLVLERYDAGRDAECAVTRVPPCPAGNLGKLRRFQTPLMVAVELGVLRECHMVHIEIEAHTDSVRRHQKINIAGLVERDLCVAGAGGERTKHHRRRTALAAYQFGNRIHLIRRKGDDGGPARQAGDLLGTGIFQTAHAGPRDDVDAGQQRFQRGAHGRCAEQHRLVTTPQVQQPVGEDVAAVQVGGKLYLVDGQKSHIGIRRHGLHCAHAKPCAGVGSFPPP